MHYCLLRALLLLVAATIPDCFEWPNLLFVHAITLFLFTNAILFLRLHSFHVKYYLHVEFVLYLS